MMGMFMQPLIFGKMGLMEILLIVLLLVLLFGSRKIPELMRGMGRGVREFKDAMDGKTPDEDPSKKTQAQGEEGKAAKSKAPGEEEKAAKSKAPAAKKK